jgi:hypothetical protein
MVAAFDYFLVWVISYGLRIFGVFVLDSVTVPFGPFHCPSFSTNPVLPGFCFCNGCAGVSSSFRPSSPAAPCCNLYFFGSPVQAVYVTVEGLFQDLLSIERSGSLSCLESVTCFKDEQLLNFAVRLKIRHSLNFFAVQTMGALGFSKYKFKRSLLYPGSLCT